MLKIYFVEAEDYNMVMAVDKFGTAIDITPYGIDPTIATAIRTDYTNIEGCKHCHEAIKVQGVEYDVYINFQIYKINVKQP
mgnify:CR=1 FL=1